MEKNFKIRFNIDRGGTFTDIFCEYHDENGKYQSIVHKILSQDPKNYQDAPAEGIRRLIEKIIGIKIGKDDKIPSKYIEFIRMGTTIATNALLERKGERCALLITEGFSDLIEIGTQSRPEIFDLNIIKPEKIYDEVFEVRERVRLLTNNEKNEKMRGNSKIENVKIGVTGEYLQVINELQDSQIEKHLTTIKEKGIKSIAVAFAHSYAFRDHENQVKQIAKRMGIENISLSSEIMPIIKFYPRGCTAVIDSYLTPAIHKYVQRFIAHFDSSDLKVLFMQSEGGMTSHENFCGSKAILSGPAGGVVGYSITTANEVGHNVPIIGLDMGGTSTDVSRFYKNWDHVFEVEIAGVSINSPQIDVNTVAAGGGSRLFYKNGLFLVGPESAGSEPGPVCYKKNGHLAITDANLVLGRLIPKFFPKIFGKNADEELDYQGSYNAMLEIANRIKNETKLEKTVEEIALGFIQIANESMCKPIKSLTQAKGYDPKEHVLAIFGGAGGQHACAIASILDIKKVYIHKYSGILSAYGLSMAEVVEELQEPIDKVLKTEHLEGIVENTFNELINICKNKLGNIKSDDFEYKIEKFLLLRYEGNDYNISVSEPIDKNYAHEFELNYKREYGFLLENRDIVIDTARIRVSLKPKVEEYLKVIKSSEIESDKVQTTHIQPHDATEVIYEIGKKYEKLKTGVYFLDKLSAGNYIYGPSLILTGNSTINIEPGWKCHITNYGNLIIELDGIDNDININKDDKNTDDSNIVYEKEPIELSLFAHRFMSIADQMGRHLQRTAVSTNIKERLDFSCAVFNNDGSLVANAPHLPVHLGAMQEAVKAQIHYLGSEWKDGDTILANHPAAGGSHLPDMTVITPVYSNKKVAFYLANRGHHSDIGGLTPGSMPHLSRTLEDEGAAIFSHKLVENGVFQEEKTKFLFHDDLINKGKPASRGLKDNISDLKAQVASNTKGVLLLTQLIDKYGLRRVQANMKFIQDTAELSVRNMLKDFSDAINKNDSNTKKSEFTTVYAEDFMDDGSKIALSITLDNKNHSAKFDFTGTSMQVYGNINTPKSVTYSAIIYALRSMVKSEIPLNQGCLVPITIHIPEKSLLNPEKNCAVVGGNVLTSQRITDIILKAFNATAASQGCMNNFTFGNDSLGYYETIGGGAGAGPDFHGKSGIQVHMTNTRITDVEIIEKRFPVLIEAFSYRSNSGGKGKWNGGDGLVRKYRFLEELTASILSERRVIEPFGLNGGGNAKLGLNIYIKKDGSTFNLGGKNSVDVQPGDCVAIMTPGGGAYGKEDTENESTTDKKNNENQKDQKYINEILNMGSLGSYYRNQYST